MNQIIGLVMICVAFAAPILTYRFTYAVSKNDGAVVLVVIVIFCAITVGLAGLSMVVGTPPE